MGPFCKTFLRKILPGYPIIFKQMNYLGPALGKPFCDGRLGPGQRICKVVRGVEWEGRMEAKTRVPKEAVQR
jgi:hypothetical protein